MRRTLLLLALSSAAALSFEARPALACKVGAAPGYNAAAGSPDEPPALRIADIAMDLGPNYGGPGPGDCSQLGHVVIALASPDGATLDGKFGARIDVKAGRLPVVINDLTSWVAPIEGNKVALTLADDRPSADFTISVRAVNAAGQMGPESSPVRRLGERSGCSVMPHGHEASPPFLGLLVPLGLLWRRLRAPAAAP